MPVPTTIADLNTTASLNSPAGSEAIGTSLDDYIRSHAAIIKQHEADLASTSEDKGSELIKFAVQNALSAGTVGAAIKARSISVTDFPWLAKFDGVTDDTAAINAASLWLKSVGGGLLTLPAGKTVISGTGIVPRSYVHIVGQGPRGTEILANTLTPIAQVAGTQVYAGAIKSLSVTAQPGFEAGTGLALKSFQLCEFCDLMFNNFTGGTIIDIAGELATGNFDESEFPLQTSNIVFNLFSHITAYECAVGLSIFGHYGASTPSGSDAPAPDLVVTQNRYEHLTFRQVSSKGISIRGACDHEIFDTILIALTTNNSIGVHLASDPVYTGNTYCNSHDFRGLIFNRTSGGLTGLTLVKSGYGFGHLLDMSHDYEASELVSGGGTIVVLDPGSLLSYHYRTKAVSTNVGPKLGEVFAFGYRYYFDSSNTPTTPAIAFTGDPDTGFYRPGADQIAMVLGGSIAASWTTGAAFIGGPNGAHSFKVLRNTNNVNALTAQGSVSGPVSLAAEGTASDIDIQLTPKGTNGRNRIGTHTASGDAAITGYIEVKDFAGNVRKLAVIS